MSGSGIAPHIKADYPELEIVARLTIGSEVAVATPTTKNFALVSYADPEFLDIFDLNFSAGDRRAALKAPHSAVITASYAQQLFGADDPIGKSLLLNNRETVNIAGVMTEPREPSHISINPANGLLKFSLVISMDTAEALRRATISDTEHPGTEFF